MFSFFQVFLSSFVGMSTDVFNNTSFRKEQLIFDYKFARLNFHFFVMSPSDLFIVCAHIISNKSKQNTKVYKQMMVIIVTLFIPDNRIFLFLLLINTDFVLLALHRHKKSCAPRTVFQGYLL